MAPPYRLMLLAPFALLAGLSSCSSSSKPQAADAPVRIRWARDPESLDPFNQLNQNAVDANGLLHGALLAVNPQLKRFEPFLAEALPTVRHAGDSLTFLSYHLRPVATWDSGKPITAADVAFTLKLMFCKGVPNEGFRLQAAFIKDVQPDPGDDRHFTLVCQGNSPDYVQASGDFAILPEAVLDPQGTLRPYSLAEVRGHGTASRRAALGAVQAGLAARYAAATPGQHPEKLLGCGAYRLQTWSKDRRLTFVRKKNWWGNQLNGSILFEAKPSRLDYVVIPDDATTVLALRNGQLDVYPSVPANVFQRLKDNASARQQLAFYNSPTYEVVTAGFNTSRPALNDAATRQALSQLFDAAQLSQASQLGQGLLTVGLISPQEKGKYNDSLALLSYNPAQAAAQLTRAGWQRGASGWARQVGKGPAQHLNLLLRYRAGEPTYELVALQFASAAKSMGIPVQLVPTESGALRPLLQQGDFDLYVQSIKGNPFLFNFLPLFGTQAIGESNLTRFGTSATDRLLEAIASAESTAKRERLLRKFQAIMRAEMPLVPLFFVANRLIANRDLAGLHAMSLKPGYVASSIYHTVKPQ